MEKLSIRQKECLHVSKVENKLVPGKYRLLNKQKENNSATFITSMCGTAVENLSIFLERSLVLKVLKIGSKTQENCTISKKDFEMH